MTLTIRTNPHKPNKPNKPQVLSYDPARKPADGKVLRAENNSVNRTLARRFFLMQKAKNADIIGIVAGVV